jgi:hypothetical protein
MGHFVMGHFVMGRFVMERFVCESTILFNWIRISLYFCPCNVKGDVKCNLLEQTILFN